MKQKENGCNKPEQPLRPQRPSRPQQMPKLPKLDLPNGPEPKQRGYAEESYNEVWGTGPRSPKGKK